MTNPGFILDELFIFSREDLRRFNPDHTAILPNKALSFRRTDPKILPEPLELVRGLFLDMLTTNPYVEAELHIQEIIRKHLEWERSASLAS